MRYMAFSIQDWPKLIRQSYEHTAPGGWVEVQDFNLDYYSEDGSYCEGKAVYYWATTLLQACRDFGADPSPGPKLEQQFKDVGFENIVARRYKIPIGPWPKDKHLVSRADLRPIARGGDAVKLTRHRKPLVHGI